MPHPDRLYGLSIDPSGCAVQIFPDGDTTTLLAASQQTPLHDLELGETWRAGVRLRPPARDTLAAEAAALFAAGRIPALVGDQQADPLPLLEAAGSGVGLLHIAASPQLTDGAFIDRVLSSGGVARVVGVGYRSARSEEVRRSAAEPRHFPFWDHELSWRLAEGASWKRQCEGLTAVLPMRVHVSLWLDGLAGRGGVPGGLSWGQVAALLRVLRERRDVTSFDVCGLTGSAEDGALAAALVYRLAGCALHAKV